MNAILLIIVGALLGGVIKLGFDALNRKLEKQDKKLETIHVLVNSQMGDAIAKIAALESQLAILTSAPGSVAILTQARAEAAQVLGLAQRTAEALVVTAATQAKALAVLAAVAREEVA